MTSLSTINHKVKQTPQCFFKGLPHYKKRSIHYTPSWVIIPLYTHPFPSHTNIGIYNKCTNEQTLNKHIRRNRTLQFTFKQPSQINKSSNRLEQNYNPKQIMFLYLFYFFQFLAFLFLRNDFRTKNLRITTDIWGFIATNFSASLMHANG